MQLNNILYEELPEEWNGYQVNTWFQIGIQIFILNDDEEMSSYERTNSMMYLMFGNEDDTIREHPKGKEFEECVRWFLNGWYHDNPLPQKEKEKTMDYYVDQYRIYADFRQIYGINLNEADLHWWEFCGLLWNMPHDRSSFLQVMEIRKKKPRKKASREEIKAIQEAQQVYSLKQSKERKIYTKEEEQKIDAYDSMMEAIRKKKEEQQKALDEAVREFRK